MDHAQAIGVDLIARFLVHSRARAITLGLRGALLIAVALSGATRANAVQDDEFESKGFAIPDTRAARALVHSVEGHINAKRWPEAINELQKLVRDYDGDLLAGEYEVDGLRSQRPVHTGAAEYARRRMAGLPRAAREAYVRIYEADARLLLDEALEQSHRAGLARVGSLYPLTESALRAWCALGDLELEMGNTTEALLAWNRALAQLFKNPSFRVHGRDDWLTAKKRLAELEGPYAEALLHRAELVLASYDGQSDGLRLGEVYDSNKDVADRFHSGSGRTLGREMRLPGPGEGVQSLPERAPGSWSQPYYLAHDNPFRNSRRNPLHAIRSGDLVLISDSLRVTAVNAYSGRLAWKSNDAPGWAEYHDIFNNSWNSKEREQGNFFQGLDQRYALIAPAATDSIVVAPLQIPVTHSSNSKYTSINITRIIPSRRLFAFDVETGRELWNHMPQVGWNGESGTFAERTRVCGPPVIAGERVLVPSYRLQGRIDFHIACYELRTGELLWSTGLISGQRELNMFGRPEHAFSAPPVRVQGDRVVVLTQLGSLAAIDLFSGSILWETLYDQLSLQSARLRARSNPATWRNAPPVISEDVVVAGPVDSHDLLGVDLETGALLWSIDQSELRHEQSSLPVDLLLGADHNTLFLGGPKLMALSSPINLRTLPKEKWFLDHELIGSVRTGPWAALAKDFIVVPTNDEQFRVDRLLGHPEPGIPWDRQGNVLLTEGAFFTLDNRELNGYFEWGTLIKRARTDYEEHPNDLAAALSLASLLTDRSASRLRDIQVDLARPFAEEAVAVLEPFLINRQPSDRLSDQIHLSLRNLANVQRYGADPAALKTFRRARQFATSAGLLKETLFEEQALLHDAQSAEWLEVLALLESKCSELEVPCDAVPTSNEKLPFEFQFTPRLTGPSEARVPEFYLPVGLWVKLERSTMNLRLGNYEAAFEDLHRILRRYRSIELAGGTAFDFADARIARALAEGRGAGYELFEQEAATTLENARVADSPEALKLVSLYYPHSEASREAHDLLLQSSIRAGDVQGVANILQSELPENWSPRSANKRELELICSLAHMLHERGNVAYVRGLVRELVSVMPNAIIDAPGFTGKTLAQLEESLPTEVRPAPASETATFDENCREKASFQESWVFQGYAPGADQEREKLQQVAIFSTRDALMALSSNNPGTPLWTYEFQVTLRSNLPANYITFSEGRVLLHDDDWLVGLDRDTGEEVWTRESTNGPMSSLDCEDGVLLALQTPKGQVPILHALGSQTGIELWQLPISNSQLMPRPIVGSGKLAFIPRVTRKQVVVRDVFSSRKNTVFKLQNPPDRKANSHMWIEDNLLIEPHFLKSPRPTHNNITAYDLSDGAVAWQEKFGKKGQRELTAIVRYQDESYLLLRPRSQKENDAPPGQIMRLHVGLGALQPIGSLELRKRDTTIDVNVLKVSQAESPYVFLRSPSQDETRTRVRAIHLPHGKRWVHTLPIAEADMHNRMPSPALSDTTVALAYKEWPQDSAKAGVTRLRFIDRASGMTKDARDLPLDAFPQGHELILVTLGPALILIGQDQMDVLE